MPRNSCVLVSLVLACAPALAHDTGFGHSRRTLLITATATMWALEYRVMASPDEALIEMTRMDEDGNCQISSEEQQRYFQSLSRELAASFDCRTSSGEKLAVMPAGYRLDNSLAQLFLFQIASPARELQLVDRNFPHKPGQVRVIPGAGVHVELLENVDLAHAERVPLRIKRTGS